MPLPEEQEPHEAGLNIQLIQQGIMARAKNFLEESFITSEDGLYHSTHGEFLQEISEFLQAAQEEVELQRRADTNLVPPETENEITRAKEGVDSLRGALEQLAHGELNRSPHIVGSGALILQSFLALLEELLPLSEELEAEKAVFINAVPHFTENLNNHFSNLTQAAYRSPHSSKPGTKVTESDRDAPDAKPSLSELIQTFPSSAARSLDNPEKEYSVETILNHVIPLNLRAMVDMVGKWEQNTISCGINSKDIQSLNDQFVSFCNAMNGAITTHQVAPQTMPQLTMLPSLLDSYLDKAEKVLRKKEELEENALTDIERERDIISSLKAHFEKFFGPYLESPSIAAGRA